MDRFFSGPVDFSRVNSAGLLVMGAGFALSLLSGAISAKTKISKNTIKVISLIICAGGALLAILA